MLPATCVGWQVTLCDSVRQVTRHSTEIVSLRVRTTLVNLCCRPTQRAVSAMVKCGRSVCGIGHECMIVYVVSMNARADVVDAIWPPGCRDAVVRPRRVTWSWARSIVESHDSCWLFFHS